MTGGRSAPARRVGMDNYGLFPLDLSPLDTLRWAFAHGSDGVSFSGLAPAWQDRMEALSLEDLRAFAGDHGLYLEWGGAQHVPRDMTSWARKDLFEINRRAAREAVAIGATVVRSCSGGLMRWDAGNPPTEVLLRDTAEALRDQEAMLRDHGVVLAIETHFEFTSFELLRLFDMCEAEPGAWLGICLDTMNLMTMIEHPVMATRRLLPWIVSTHMKDGGVLSSLDGLATFPVALGAGVIDLAAIIGMIGTLGRPVHLSVEDHGGSFRLPIHDEAFMSRFPDLAGTELRALLELAEAAQANPGCRPLERAEWPGACESRIAHDLRQLRALIDPVPAVAEVSS
jgi:sugar phosphate isomerase/epimerase